MKKRMSCKRGRTDAERFWAKVRPEPGDACWLWVGGVTTQSRYGAFSLPGPTGKHYAVYAHRFAYELHYGPIANGMHVCHRCDVPACVNPAHLFLGTSVDNMHDMAVKGRASRKKVRVDSSRLLECLGSGKFRTASDIALFLGCSVATVQRHKKRLKK